MWLMIILDPNKAGLFESNFFWGVCGEGGGEGVIWPFSPPSSFIFQEDLIQYKFNLIQLLNSLFREVESKKI